MSGLSTDLSAVFWTGFSIFTVAWILEVFVALVMTFIGYGIRTKEVEVVDESGKKTTKTIQEKRGSSFGSRGSIVVFALFIILTMTVGFMYLSFVAENNEALTFIFRAGAPTFPGGCTQDLVNSGTCALLLRPMWYIVVFGMYGIFFSLVFGFTTLVTTMFLLGSMTLAFGLSFATYSSFDRSEWASWALAVTGALWSIGWSMWAFFDMNSASIFVAVIDLQGTKIKRSSLGGYVLADEPHTAEYPRDPKKHYELMLGGLAESRQYWQFMNPFAYDGIYAIFWLVNTIFYLWYAVEWLVGPQAPISGGFGIVEETGIMLASDVFFFGVVPFGLLGIWFFYDPGTWRLWNRRELATRRVVYWNAITGGNISTEEPPEYWYKNDPRGSIRKVQSKTPRSSSGKGKTHIVLH